MKIVYLAQSRIPSRTANSIHIMKMCQALANNGHDVHLCYFMEGEKEHFESTEAFEFYGIKNNFHITRINTFPVRNSRIRYLISSFLLLPLLFTTLRKIKPDLVYSRDIYTCCLSSLFGNKVIAEAHTPAWHGLLEAVSMQLMIRSKNFLRLVVITEALRTAYIQHYPKLDPKMVVTAHDGADPVDLRSINKRTFGRIDVLQVGYVGHLYEGKGVEVIEAIAPQMTHVDFHIIGGLESDIQRWRQRIDCDNVTFHGFVPQSDISEYIAGLDVCLLPNQRTVKAYGGSTGRRVNDIAKYTSPLKMFDYMAHGRAIIASDLAVLREVLTDKLAILVPPDNYTEWIAAVDKMHSSSLREQFGQQCQQKLLTDYTWQERAKKILVGLGSSVGA